jgi:hypothetical protein
LNAIRIGNDGQVMTRKICMIVHQYPPDAGATAYRMAYRAKFLQTQGYEVDIFAPGHSDETYIQSPGIRIHRVSAPTSSGSVNLDYTQLKKTGRSRIPEFLQPLAGYLRWLPHLISKLRHFDGSDTILYTYNNPVTLHLAALATRKRFSVWVCEFRDPIAGYEYSARGLLGRISDGWLEKQVLKHANVICMRRGIQAGPEDYVTAKGKVVLLPDYGINLDLFTGFEQPNNDFIRAVGVYAGTVFSDISFAALSSGLGLYCERQGDAVIQLFGPEHQEHFKHGNLHYGGNVEFETLLDEYRKAHFLIVYDLSESKSSISSKFFPSKLAEMIAVCRPVLFIGNPGSQTAKLVTGMNLGVCASDDSDTIAEAINQIMEGIKEQRFDLGMNDKKRKLIDAKGAERAFAEMLSGIPSH